MVNNKPYKRRTHEQLLRAIPKLLNSLDMRDWCVTLETGDIPPKELINCHENAASVCYETSMLKAVVYINIKLCKEKNEDPLWNLYHEIFHIWQNYRDEEYRCNLLAVKFLESK